MVTYVEGKSFTINLRANSDHTDRKTTLEPIEERNP